MAINRSKIQAYAEKLVGQGKIPAAIEQYKILLADQPNDLTTINRVGDLLARTAKTSEAGELFARAASLYTTGGFFLKAIAIYKKVLKLDPGAVDPRLRLADLYARRDLTTEARAEYITVAERFVRDGNDARAREVYEKLIRMEPGDVKARTALAEIYFAKGDDPRAFAELQRAAGELERLRLNSEALVVHRRILGQSASDVRIVLDSIRGAIRLGDPGAAIAAARNLRERFPDEISAVEVLIEALELGGNESEADDLVKSALPNEGQEPVVRAVQGRLHARAGRITRATPLLLGAASDLIKVGRLSEAAQALDTLLAVDPSSRVALEKRLEVARAAGAAEDVAFVSQRIAELAASAAVPTSQAGSPDTLGSVETEPAQAPSLAAPRVADAPARKPATPPPTLTRDEKDFLNEHLTEAEVFVKYGLLERAIDPLQSILARFPDHLETHERLKAIYVEQGNRARVVERCLSIAELHETGGRREEAIGILLEARNLDPDHPQVREGLDRLGLGATPRPATPPTPPAPAGTGAGDVEVDVEEASPASSAAHADAAGEGAAGGGFFDLAGEFGDTLAEALQTESVSTEPAEESQSFDEIFKAFQQRVEEEVDSEDFKTHYDLAIAYKEMGLIDEAVAEFQYVARDPQRVIECCAMLGLCFREKGMPDLAEKWYVKALESGRAAPDQVLGLNFELGEAYLELGERAKAKECFLLVAKVDGTYREVAARLGELESGS